MTWTKTWAAVWMSILLILYTMNLKEWVLTNDTHWFLTILVTGTTELPMLMEWSW